VEVRCPLAIVLDAWEHDRWMGASVACKLVAPVWEFFGAREIFPQPCIVVVEAVERIVLCIHRSRVAHPAVVKDAHLCLAGAELSDASAIVTGAEALRIAPGEHVPRIPKCTNLSPIPLASNADVVVATVEVQPAEQERFNVW